MIFNFLNQNHTWPMVAKVATSLPNSYVASFTYNVSRGVGLPLHQNNLNQIIQNLELEGSRSYEKKLKVISTYIKTITALSKH